MVVATMALIALDWGLRCKTSLVFWRGLKRIIEESIHIHICSAETLATHPLPGWLSVKDLNPPFKVNMVVHATSVAFIICMNLHLFI